MKKIVFALLMLTTAFGAFAQDFEISDLHIQQDHVQINTALFYPCGHPSNTPDLGERALQEFREWLATVLDRQPNGPFLPMEWFEQTVTVNVLNDNVAVVTAQIPTVINGQFVFREMEGINTQLANGSLVVTGVVSLEENMTKARLATTIVTIYNGF